MSDAPLSRFDVEPAPSRKRLLTRRGFLKAAGAAVLAGMGTAAHATYVAPYALTVEHVRFAIPGLAARWRGKRIVHLSDLHVGRRVAPSLVTRACQMALDLKPDAVCITGDLVDHELQYVPFLAAELRKLADRTMVIASLGNHDYGPRFGTVPFADHVAGAVRNAGVVLLRNQLHQPRTGTGELCFVGLDDLWARQMDPAAVDLAPPDAAVIVLSHNPDTYDDIADKRWDLMLSGHTHGGQVWLPFYGPPILPVEHKDRAAGLLRLDPNLPHRALYVTRGIGHVQRVRFNCPPEITCFTLHAA